VVLDACLSAKNPYLEKPGVAILPNNLRTLLCFVLYKAGIIVLEAMCECQLVNVTKTASKKKKKHFLEGKNLI